MLTLQKINKSFGTKQVLFDIETQVSQGEIVGILGPNGAGKSTLMRIISGYYFPDSGDVQIGFESIFTNNSLKKKIGYLPEVNPLYEDMGVDEFLSFTAGLKGVDTNIEAEINKVLKMTGLEDKKYKYINTLSKGYRQRVGLASALIGDPEILILDEPTEGLDPNQRDEIRTLIQELGRSKTILISSHVLNELSSLVSRVIIISDGRIKLDDTMKHIEQTHGGKLRIEVHFTGHIPVTVLREKFPDITDINHRGQTMEIICSRDIRQELQSYLVNHYQILEFFSEKLSLSDVFFETVK